MERQEEGQGWKMTQLHEPMSDWRQPDEDDEGDEDESVHQKAAWEKRRKRKRKDEERRQTKTGVLSNLLNQSQRNANNSESDSSRNLYNKCNNVF